MTKKIKLCSVDGRNAIHYARGFCKRDYVKARREGIEGNPYPAPIERFFEYVQKTDFCWSWEGAKNKRGYGVFWAHGKKVLAHKFLWEFENGLVPEGLVLDHRVCDNPPCVRPDHLLPCTSAENILRGNGPTAKNLLKTHCPKGHPYSEENTYVMNTKEGKKNRVCRTCDLARKKSWQHEK